MNMTSSNIADRILIFFTAVQSSNQLLGAVVSYTGHSVSVGSICLYHVSMHLPIPNNLHGRQRVVLVGPSLYKSP